MATTVRKVRYLRKGNIAFRTRLLSMKQMHKTNKASGICVGYIIFPLTGGDITSQLASGVGVAYCFFFLTLQKFDAHGDVANRRFFSLMPRVCSCLGCASLRNRVRQLHMCVSADLIPTRTRRFATKRTFNALPRRLACSSLSKVTTNSAVRNVVHCFSQLRSQHARAFFSN